ncbi:MAG: condensation domain-containing protein [Oscillospiraceae bacterium]|jgi:polyketide synthase PksN|nr:condensation domain-containing protein [Oscillospiraceae bacterium]
MSLKLDSDNVEDILPLTRMQHEILFANLLYPQSYMYCEQQCYFINGHIDARIFEKAWQRVVSGNEILRTVFRWEGLSRPVQVILKNKAPPFQYIDFSAEQDSLALCDHLLESLWRDKTDIRLAPFRVVLCKLSPTAHHMIIRAHHIILDGWSNSILLKEFYESYAACLRNRPLVQNKKLPLKEYLLWLDSRGQGDARQFWTRYLEGYSEVQDGKSKNPLPQTPDILTYRLPSHLYQRLKSLARHNDCTIAGVFYTLWGLSRVVFEDSGDVIFGVTLSGRQAGLDGISDTVGLFIKTLPFRLRRGADGKIVDLFRRATRTITDIERYQHVPLSEIMPRTRFQNMNVLRSVVVMQNYTLDPSLTADAENIFSLSLYASRYETNLDMAVGIKAFGEDLEIEFSYQPYAYTSEQVGALSQTWENLMRQIVNDGGDTGVDHIINELGSGLTNRGGLNKEPAVKGTQWL